MNLVAITVCCQYSDFLSWSILNNRNLFNRWIIVTDTKDQKTKDLCTYWGIECIQTDVFYENGSFNKYAGINEALKKVKSGWVLFLDADIILPPHTKRVLDNLKLDKSNIYGIDRFDLRGINQWVEFVNQPFNLIDNWLVTSGSYPLGGRVVHVYGNGNNPAFTGWKPIGFFQLAHTDSFSKYPDNCTGADHCDIEFANNYLRENRILIPEILAAHLISDDANWGSNWNSRITTQFL